MLGKGCSGHRPIPSVCQHASGEGCPKHPMPPRTEETKRTEPQAPCPEFVNTPPKRVVSVQKESPAHAHDRVAAHALYLVTYSSRASPVECPPAALLLSSAPRALLPCRLSAVLGLRRLVGRDLCQLEAAEALGVAAGCLPGPPRAREPSLEVRSGSSGSSKARKCAPTSPPR